MVGSTNHSVWFFQPLKLFVKITYKGVLSLDYMKIQVRLKMTVFVLFLSFLCINVVSCTVRQNVSLAPFHLLGYDCSAPRNIRDFTISQLEGGCLQSLQSKIISREKVRVTLLQREEGRRQEGFRCQLKRTKIIRYCGVYDHETTDAANSFYHRIVPLEADQCRNMVAHHSPYKVRLGNGKTLSFEVKLNAINYAKYFYIGNTYLNPSGEVSCNGSTYIDPHTMTRYDRIYIEVNDELLITKEIITFKNQVVVATPEHETLPCSFASKLCTTPFGSYVWDYSDDYCPLAQVRQFEAERITDSLNNVVLLSSDDSKIRLMEIGPASVCNSIVTATNYPTLFVSESWPEGKSRQIAPQEVQLPIFIRNRQDFLWSQMESSMEAGFRQTLLNDCQLQRSQERIQSWLRITDPGINTYLLGNGTYATTAGEVVYLYQCRPQEVRARHEEGCYESLPVHYGNTSLFLEPLTHRLLRQGIKIPCNDRFLPKFKTIRDQWIMASPQVLEANKPAMLVPAITELNFQLPEFPDIDWSTGGIYTDEDLSAMQNYLEFPRIRQALESHLAWQATQGHYDGNQPLTPSLLFPQQFPSLSSYILSGLWSALRKWGEFVSMMIALFFLGKIVVWIIKMFFNCWALVGAHGLTKHLLWSPCPDLLYLFRYRQVHRQRPPQENPPTEDPMALQKLPDMLYPELPVQEDPSQDSNSATRIQTNPLHEYPPSCP